MNDTLPQSFNGIKCDIVGMGISNVALAKYLHAEGARITLRDKRQPSPDTLQDVCELAEKSIFGDGYLSELDGDYIFRVPSVRPDLPELLSAIESGAHLSSEWELFFDRCPCNTIGITGSDGKTTTVTLVEMILNEAFSSPDHPCVNGVCPHAYAAGNIGLPLISLLPRLRPCDYVVAELSSFQLMTLKRSPMRAAITDITPNHLDYHRDMDEYIGAKYRIGAYGCDMLVHPFPKDSANKISTIISKNKINYEIYCDNDTIYLDGKAILDVRDIALPGAHNIRNYMTAIALTSDIAEPKHIRRIARDFRGVSHRMELVCEKQGVKFYDSSIDSTPDRTATTLACFHKPLTVICGGYDKNLEYSTLASALERYASDVIVTGAAASKILSAIDSLPSVSFSLRYEPEFEAAVRHAAEVTPSGGSVLLSPACASFDSFANYRERSKCFVEILRNL